MIGIRLISLLIVTVTLVSLLANLLYMTFSLYVRNVNGKITSLEEELWRYKDRERLPFFYYNCGSFNFRYSTKLYIDTVVCLVLPFAASGFFYCSMIVQLLRRKRDQLQVFSYNGLFSFFKK